MHMVTVIYVHSNRLGLPYALFACLRDHPNRTYVVILRHVYTYNPINVTV